MDHFILLNDQKVKLFRCTGHVHEWYSCSPELGELALRYCRKQINDMQDRCTVYIDIYDEF